MPIGWCTLTAVETLRPPKVGRPKRDRGKGKAARAARRRNRS